jgi:hypothetical protein
MYHVWVAAVLSGLVKGGQGWFLVVAQTELWKKFGVTTMFLQGHGYWSIRSFSQLDEHFQ